MQTCPNCGRENPDGSKFCGECGSALAAETVQARELRKLVTVVFADITGSTALGEQVDPELLRRVLERYFEEMRRILEHHGGTVEKFIGDAIMAVFGIPHLHEEDALRALRAAAEMRERLAILNEQLELDYGMQLQARLGVASGEVVAGDPGRGDWFVTGDAVNVAERLERSATSGEIRPHRATFAGEDAFRFRHLLIHETAYDAVPKEVRAELHEGCSRCLGQKGGDFDELVAYHLEQAVRFRNELGPLDAHSQEQAMRAGNLLAVAARRASARGDTPAAVGLFRARRGAARGRAQQGGDPARPRPEPHGDRRLHPHRAGADRS